MCYVFNRDEREVAISKLHEAKQVFDQWKSSYFEMRAEIEESGSYSRWEFDRKRLFERTDYMASVCQDLCNVLQVSLPCMCFINIDFICVCIKSFERLHPDLCCADFGGVL